MASARCRRWLRCCCRGARCRGCRRWRRLRLGSQQTWTHRRHRFTGGVEVPPYAKPAAVYKGITRGFTVSTVPVMLAALPFAPRPPRGGFASSQLGGSGNRTSAFRVSCAIIGIGVAPRHHQPRHAIPSLPLPSADAGCEGSLGAGLPSPRERGFPWARRTTDIAIVVEVFSHHADPACRFTRAHAWRWALRRTFSGMLQASPRYATAHAAG